MRRRHVWTIGSRLPAEVASLLDEERDRVDPPEAEVEARVWTRVASTVGLPPPGGGGEGGSSSGGDAPPPGGSPAVEATVTAGSSPWLSGPLAKVAAVAALLGAGGVAGVAVDRTVAPPRVMVVSVPVARVPPAPSPGAVVPPAASGPTPVDATEEPAAAPAMNGAAPSKSAPTPSRDRDLAAERAILERARAALSRGDAATALATLDEHASTFPRGRLGEEREALGVQALLAAGRRADAEARFARLRTRSPSSLFVPVIEAMLDGG